MCLLCLFRKIYYCFFMSEIQDRPISWGDVGLGLLKHGKVKKLINRCESLRKVILSLNLYLKVVDL